MERVNSTPLLASFAIGGMAILLGLNVNGVLAMAIGAQQAASGLILGLAVLVLGLCRGRALATPLFVLLAAVVASYLFLGALAVGFTSEPLQSEYIARYLGILLIGGATASYSAGLQEEDARKACVFLKWILLTACVGTLFSQQLYKLYSNPLAAAYRNAGLFGNPNEAGIVATIALALALSAPARSRWLALGEVLLASSAMLVTLSKASLAATFLVLAVYALSQRRFAILAVAMALAAATPQLVTFLLESGLFARSMSITYRLMQFRDLFGGDFTQSALTGRDITWEVGLQKIAEHFPGGAGLGTMHALEGVGLRDSVYNRGMGVHNTYLMILGEAGIVAFLIFASFNGLFLLYALRASNIFPVLYWIIIQVDFMSSHTTLENRFHNLAIGSCIGLLVGVAWRRRDAAVAMRNSRSAFAGGRAMA